MKQFLSLSLISCSLLLSGCGTFSGVGTDNNPKPAPLEKFAQQLAVKPLWSVKAGKGSGDDYLKLAPAISNGVIYTADYSGQVTATRVDDGRQIWQINTKQTITSGVAAKQNLIFFGTQDGQVIALQSSSGKQVWRTTVPGEVLATPTVTENNVWVKTIDGNLCALAIQTGKGLWTAQHETPTLIMRGSSSAQVAAGLVIAGFADGKLVAYDTNTGAIRWEHTVAMPQGSSIAGRMVDIDVDPFIANGTVYVATYQGNIAALNLATGNTLWEHPISSYAGLTLDANAIYIADANSHIWAFARHNGQVLWKQNKLTARHITSPVLINGTLAVADSEGYVHFLAVDDGHFVAREQVNKNAVIATPLVVDNMLYVYSTNGSLAAYRINK